MKIQGTVVGSFVLTAKESNHLQKLVDRVVSLREISYKKYKYSRNDQAIENAQERVNDALLKVELYIENTLSVSTKDAISSGLWDSVDTSFLSDVQGPKEAQTYWKKAAEILTEEPIMAV